MKYTVLILAVVLSACGGSSSQTNPFQEVLGKPLANQPNVTTPTDPFAPVLKKN